MMKLDKFFMQVSACLDVYAEWFSDRPLAATILIYVAGVLSGCAAVYSALGKLQ